MPKLSRIVLQSCITLLTYSDKGHADCASILDNIASCSSHGASLRHDSFIVAFVKE